jgi:hypothetical protein
MSTGWEVDDRIRGSSISTLELSGATARLSNQPFTHTFTELAQAVRSRGLQGRRRGFYVMIFAVLVLALAGSASGMILLEDSWLQLLLAGGLGLIFTQFAFSGTRPPTARSSSPAQPTTAAGACLRRWWATAGG